MPGVDRRDGGEGANATVACNKILHSANAKRHFGNRSIFENAASRENAARNYDSERDILDARNVVGRPKNAIQQMAQGTPLDFAHGIYGY